MRTLVPTFLATALAFTLSFGLSAQEKGKGGPKAPPKNLQVLKAGPELIPTMEAFVTGLGLQDKGGCNFCHEQDRSSDAKPEKVMARNMIKMVQEINKNFPDGKEHVTCYTCHRGDTMPKMAP